MINSYKEYKEYLRIECSHNSLKTFFFPIPGEEFIKWLRRTELFYNKGKLFAVAFLFCYWRYSRLSLKTGISIPKNVCGKGLFIPHYGSIVVNAACRIGRNCMIQNNVNIGANGGSSKAPQIGDNVYIGPGAVIFGDITIANGCYIGANAVVNKSVLIPNSVVVGVPAKVIKIDPIHWWQKNRLKLEE